MMVKPTVVNGSDTRAMTEMDMKRLGTWERKILRRIHGPEVKQGTQRIRINQELWELYKDLGGSGSSVGTATDYRLDGPGSNLGRDEIFPPVQTGPGAHPASCKMGTRSFLGVKCGEGVLLNTHPLLVVRSWKSRAIPLPTLWATPGL